jgi:hypothetical protein
VVTQPGLTVSRSSSLGHGGRSLPGFSLTREVPDAHHDPIRILDPGSLAHRDPGRQMSVSSWPWASQRPAGEPGEQAAAGAPAHERPPAPGAAKLAGSPCRSRTGSVFPGPFRSDDLGYHRMHDILLTRGLPSPGAVIDIVREGYDSSAASNSSAISSRTRGRDEALDPPEPPFGAASWWGFLSVIQEQK